MDEKLPSAVPMSAAGIVYQFERALYHLSRLPPRLFVGIEAIDDLAAKAADEVIYFVEQDKFTAQESGYDVSDRSEALWKTLKNWLIVCDKFDQVNSFIFVTNGPINGKLINLLSTPEKDEAIKETIVNNILAAKHTYTEDGKPKGVTQLIKEVQSYGKDALTELVGKIMVHYESNETELQSIREKTIENLHVPSSIDRDALYRVLRGWLDDITMQSWSMGKSAWISGQLFTDYLHELKSKMIKKRIREKAAVYIPVTSDQITNEKSSRFVHHLAEVHATDEMVVDAITDYIQFSQEKLRLTLEEGVVDE